MDGPPTSTAAMGPMTPDDRQTFLSRPLIARLATSLEDRPRVLPMWFLWDGMSILMETGARFPNVRVLEANPHAAITIDEAVGPLGLRAVVMRGTVEVLRDPAFVAATVRLIYAKYVGEDGLATPAVREMLRGDHVILRFTPRSETSWDTTR
jgi:nitroimidazol reductase NimA-like FMN-containing flavoprotein (pyridoxamine 5'-phosphate oxidase superfamily)